MEVTKNDFRWQLNHMLRALSISHFCAVDFEFSGGSRQTLQERYQETKDAANKYQILQVGFTVAREEPAKGAYVLRPYNMYLSPVLEVKLDIERIFSFQSGAVEFLLANGFCMEMPFINGVPYLSRDEERDAVALENARMNKLSIADIHLAADEVESRTFVMRVRQEITEWVENKSVRGRKLQAVFSLPNLPVQKHPSEYLNISADANAHAILHGNERGLNNFQKRLVHQLVRAEFPSFVSISRGTFIQLVAYDKPREDALKKTRMKSYLDKVSRQIGLRWFFEGLAGGDISSLDPLSMLKPNPDKKPKWIDVEKENKEFNEIQELIKKRPPVLVGHNIFTDLVNLYRCFFGPLPDTVEEFQRAIHDLFPLVIDTKYLATHGNPSPNAKSGLEELDKDLGTMPVPLIEVHSEHPAYNSATPIHEAGYDSMMTARVLIRLAAALNATAQHGNTTGEESLTPPDERACNIEATPKTDAVQLPVVTDISGNNTNTLSVSKPSQSSDGGAAVKGPVVAIKTKKQSAKKTKPQSNEPPAKNSFFHSGKFDLLDLSIPATTEYDSEDESDHNSSVLLESTTNLAASNSSSQGPSTPKPANDLMSFDDWSLPKSAAPPPKPAKYTGPKAAPWIPPWESPFWQMYGNMLRVNGTVEGVCRLGGVPEN